MVARRNWTRAWWREKRGDYDLVTSVAVMEELKAGSHPRKSEVLKLAAAIPALPMKDDVYFIVDQYIRRKVMPANPRGDALHLALAAYNRCHFLLTWNCRHLANANKFDHIQRVNLQLGLFNPILTTPFEML
jgi:hypothetical protein